MSRIVSNHKNADVLLSGDFNLPDINWKAETIDRHQYNIATNEMFLNTTLDLNLNQMVDENTRENAILDLVFTNQPNLIQNLEIKPGLGDHDIVEAEYIANPQKEKKAKREIYLWKRANTNSMAEEITQFAEQVLQDYNVDSDINELWQCTKNKIIAIMKEHVPTKITSTKTNKPWMNSEIKRALRQKKKWFKRLKSRPSETVRKKYIEAKRIAQRKCREAYAAYLNDAVLDNKRFWSLIKSKNKEHTGIATLKDKNGTKIIDSEEKANVLNEQFSSAFSDPSGTFTGKMTESNLKVMDAIQLSEKGIYKLLSTMDEKKATGPDNVSAKFIKTFAHQLTPIFKLLYQTSLSQGKIPDDWKKAYIVPIFKKGDTHKPENYRPVSLTSITCKVLEHIISSNIMSHLDNHNILTDVQHGFRRHRSCESQLITTIDDFVNTLNNHGQTDAVLLDFSKAFDKVHHRSLILKLENYGIGEPLLSWITSFLTGRSQEVLVNNKKSKPIPVLSGVPQGTVLGPILFLIYINDMPDRLSEGTKIRLFADDSLLYRDIKSQDDTNILQRDLTSLQDWEKEWRMEFHPGKCKVIQITNKRSPTISKYSIHGEVLENTSEAEYLGITLHNKMSWNPHIEKICKKANNRLSFLRRNIPNCPPKVKENAYSSIVRPILEYSSSVWDPHTKKNINKIEQIHRRACKFFHNTTSSQNISSSHTTHNKYASLRERRAKQKLITFHKAQHEQIAIPTDHLKENSRKANNFVLPSSKVNAHLYSFYPSTIRLWNSLPAETKKLETTDKFKREIDRIKLIND